MKIINIVQDFNAGGIQKLLLEYLRFFNNNSEIDYRVVVLEKKYGSIYDKVCEKEGLKITYLNSFASQNKHYYIRKILDWWRYNYPLLKYLTREKPDIVHTHNTRIFIRIQRCIKKLCKKFKWFHTLHSDPFAVADAHVQIARKMFEKYGVHPICLNETQFLKARERYGIKTCDYLFNAFNQEELLKHLKQKKEAKSEMGIPEDYLVVGCVGRIAPVKNFPFFIDVMNEVVKINPKCMGIIVGDNSSAKEVVERIHYYNLENNIKLIGVRGDVQNIYNTIDRFVITSITEASAFAILEAQLFDKYCIVSNAVPKESFCSEKRIVVLDLNQSPQIWANQILKPTLFAEQVERLENYSITNTANKMIMIYQQNR